MAKMPIASRDTIWVGYKNVNNIIVNRSGNGEAVFNR